jgi:hypothetical protein
MTGTIIRIPPHDELGSGPTIRWDNGHVQMLGSMSQFEVL